MSQYFPDCWQLVKIKTPDDELYKVFAMWSGGYAYGASWKLSSGVTKVEEKDGSILFYNSSGSVYIVNKDSRMFNAYGYGVFEHLVKNIKEGYTLEVIEEDPLTINYGGSREH